jgi:hypothetical protein
METRMYIAAGARNCALYGSHGGYHGLISTTERAAARCVKQCTTYDTLVHVSMSGARNCALCGYGG